MSALESTDAILAMVYEVRKGSGGNEMSIWLKTCIIIIGALLCYNFLKKKCLSKKYLISSIVVSALMAGILSGGAPTLKDELTLCALGQSNSSSQSQEIVLEGFTIDGQYVSIPQPQSGKWFWSGEKYMWRPETDHRQPSGTTRKIVMEIPAGKEREILFQRNEWGGKVEIILDKSSQIADTYVESNILIKGSSNWKLILNAAIEIFLFLLIWVAAIAAALRCYKITRCSQRITSKMWYAFLSIIVLCGMIFYAGHTSLWCDELGQIGWASGSIGESIEFCAKMQDATPPLFAICANIWYKITPYGESWLLLLPIVPTALSVYVIGLLGEKIYGKQCGILCSIFMALSSTVWLACAYEFRSYAFVVFFATLSFYAFVSSTQNQSNSYGKRHSILYAISLVGMVMSHYFGFVVCGGFFIAECYLIKKHKNWKRLLCFAPTIVIGGLWCIIIFVQTLQSKSFAEIANWYPIPSFSHIKSLLEYLSGYSDVYYWIILWSISIAIVFLSTKQRNTRRYFYYLFSVFIPVFLISVIFLYGRFTSASTMWEERYFLVLIPFLCVSCAIGISIVHEKINITFRNGEIAKNVSCCFLTLVLLINCMSTISSAVSRQPYREAADWLYTQSNYIFNEDTLVMIGPSSLMLLKGWNDFYITRKGQRDPVSNIFSTDQMTEEEILKYNRIYLQYSQMEPAGWVNEILTKYYVIEIDMPEIQMRTYVKGEQRENEN